MVIPEGVTSIGEYAFAQCTDLIKITIPLSVTSIGNNAFDGCSALVNVTYEGTDDDWSVIDIGENNESLTSANLLRLIPTEYLTFDEITGTITECNTSLSGAVTIPSEINGTSVTAIGDYAFLDCINLTEINIPEGVTNIGKYSFKNCKNLTDIYYTGTQEQWETINIETSGNTYLTSATIHYEYIPA